MSERTQWDEYIQNAAKSLGICAKICVSTLKKDSDELLPKFESLIRDYCQIDLNHKATLESLEEMHNYYDDKDNDLKIPVKKYFEDVYKEKKNHSEPIDRHRFVKEFNKECNVNEADVSRKEIVLDEDVVSDNSFVPPTDPITKATIRNPVRNSRCGHVYEKESILQVISNKKMRCPYIGCPTRDYLNKRYLEDYDELRRKIDNYFLKNV